MKLLKIIVIFGLVLFEIKLLVWLLPPQALAFMGVIGLFFAGCGVFLFLLYLMFESFNQM
jgi:hypothetical protein